MRPIAALDVTDPNMMRITAGMGKPTRNELLAEYYLRAADVAAVWIDAEGHVGAALKTIRSEMSLGQRGCRIIPLAVIQV